MKFLLILILLVLAVFYWYVSVPIIIILFFINKKKKNSEKKIVIDIATEKKVIKNDGAILSNKIEAPLPLDSEKRNSTLVFKLPSMELLDRSKRIKGNDIEVMKQTKITLEKVLSDFKIKGIVVNVHIGSAFTYYEVSIAAGTRLNSITKLHREIALTLAVKEILIQAPIPGKNTIGIGVPNSTFAIVPIRKILSKKPKTKKNIGITVVLGEDVMGQPLFVDITRLPHMLIAGKTGSGKTVALNTFIISLLMRYTPEEVRLVLIDPKKVELSNYNGVPHLLAPVVTDPNKASVALQKLVVEMDKRYEIFAEHSVKNISGYNEKIEKENSKNPEMPQPKMPYIVVIIDELADLMLIAAKEVEESILRITQLARQVGIHLIVATQRPSADIITGIIKFNIPSRIAFATATSNDSKIIFDIAGAEELLGRGDMLYLPAGENAPTRIQGAYVTEEEIQKVVRHTIMECAAGYDNSLTINSESANLSDSDSLMKDCDDPLYDEVVEFTIASGKISASMLQRRFRLGYNRAARIIDLLEDRGIIGSQSESKPREVLEQKKK